LLDRTGLIAFPFGLGAVAGFWAADSGVRWLPEMLGAVLVLAAFSLICFALGRWLRGRAEEVTSQGRRLRRRVVFAIALGGLAAAGRLALFWVEAPSPLTALMQADFDRAFAIDAARYEALDAGLEALLVRLEAHPELAAHSEAVLSADAEALLKDAWPAFYDQAFALDGIRIFFEDWYRFDPSRVERDRHLRSFLLTFAAELSLYEKSARLCELILDNPNAKKFLDAPHPEAGLPADTFSQLRQELQGSRDQARVVAGERYLEFADVALSARAVPSAGLRRRVAGHLAVIGQLGTLERAEFTVRGDVQPLKRALRRAWFPTRKGVAEAMGNVRFRRIGWYLVDQGLQAEMDAQMAPGDLMLSRKNWYLSNVGLPGFWPHAILYVGTPERLNAAFDDPEVAAWIEEEVGAAVSYTDYLARRHPAAWRRYLAGVDGDPARVIEAVGEGVVINSMEHASGDYMAALRPRMSALAKAKAVAESFEHLDKPYDWDFDFATEHAVVCSELVWRAWRVGEDLGLETRDIAGRQTLPPTDLATLYAETWDDPERPLDFVWFIDASEDEQRAFASDEEAFRASASRAKWDWAQE